MPSPLAFTSASRLPSTESYFRRWASVAALVRSLTATKSMSLSPSAARMMLRPIRPKPLMPTRTAMSALLCWFQNWRSVGSEDPPLRSSILKHVSLMNALAGGQTVQIYFHSRKSLAETVLSPFHPAMYLAYSFLSLLVLVLVSPYFLYQAVRYKKYVGSLGQRLGYLPIALNVDGDESIWIHAVSVGEALTARALVADLKVRYPRLRLFLSTTTIAGQQVAKQSLSQVDGIFYFPFDWAFIVR